MKFNAFAITVRRFSAPALFSLILLVSAGVAAEVAVIVHPNNHNQLDARDIARIFLGRTKTFPDGTGAVPLDRPEDSLARAVFIANVLKKNHQRLKTHWAELLFTGKGIPPEVVDSDSDVKARVSQNPAAIGYIDAAAVDDSVRVVYSF